MMRTGWTGGQYSLFRMLLGAYLVCYFLSLPGGVEPDRIHEMASMIEPPRSPLSIDQLWDSGSLAMVVAVFGAGLGACLAAGSRDRAAALLLGALWYVSHAAGGVPEPIAWAPLAVVLLLHAALPPAPYLSWAARGRPDPGGGWGMPGGVLLAAWVFLSLAYASLGISRLFDPAWLEWSVLRGEEVGIAGGLKAVPWIGAWGFVGVEILFGPLALLRGLRRWLWALMLARHLIFAATGAGGPAEGLVLAHLFIFDPAWIPAASRGRAGTLFYDGRCGLCHRAVRFLLAEDREGRAFRFAPLQGESFARLVPAADRGGMPDSLVLRTPEGTLLVRSRAMRAILARLGGVWRLLGGLGALVPPRAADLLYDAVAHLRHRLFREPPGPCPAVTEDLRNRFDS